MHALTDPRRRSSTNPTQVKGRDTPQDPEPGRNGEQTTTEEMTMKQCNADGQRGRSDWAEETQSREPTGRVMSRLSASGPHGSSLWRRLRTRENAATLLRGARTCLALLAGLAVLALAVPVQAQTSVQLVSTLQQTSSNSPGVFTSFDSAQAFMTGTDTNGYKLTSVDLSLSVGPSASGWVYSVSVWSADASGNPNASLGTLTNPAFTAGNDVTHTFTTTGTGIDLLTSTPYVIVVDVTTTGADAVQINNTRSDAEDSTKAAGWSIANTSLYRTWNTTGSWTSFDQTRQIRVNGYAKSGAPNTPPTAANNTVTTVVDRAYEFRADDFGFVDTNAGDTLASVKIVTPPALGTLAFDGTDVTLNQVVTKTNIDDGDLIFTPVDGASGDPYTTFTFKVNDGTVDSASAYTMTINVTAGSACAAPDFGTRRNIWTGTVTVEPNTVRGVPVTYGFDARGPIGALNSTAFNTGMNAYTIDGIFVDDHGSDAGNLIFSLSGTEGLTTLEVAALRLHVCETHFDFSDADEFLPSTTSYSWTEDLDWSMEATRTVYLSLPGNNAAPTAAHNTVTTVVDRPYTFEANDFGFADTNTGDTLASVKIVTLPALGTLALDGTAVMQNDVVAWDDIEDDKLTFTPVAGASGTGYATFTFKVNDGTVDSASAYTMTIDVTDPLACAAPDLAGRNQIWTGELTVGTIIGFGNLIEGYGFSSPSATGALNNRTFNTDRNGYTVDFVGVLVGGGNNGDFLFSPTSRLTAAEKAALRLHVCDTPYDFSDAALSSLVSS